MQLCEGFAVGYNWGGHVTSARLCGSRKMISIPNPRRVNGNSK